MADSSKPIQFSGHASQQLPFRGATEGEVVEAILTAPWHPAEEWPDGMSKMRVGDYRIFFVCPDADTIEIRCARRRGGAYR